MSNQEQNLVNRLSKILGFKVPMDGMMTAIAGKQMVDIIALDKKLQSRTPYVGSMNKFITEKYGTDALELLNKLC